MCGCRFCAGRWSFPQAPSCQARPQSTCQKLQRPTSAAHWPLPPARPCPQMRRLHPPAPPCQPPQHQPLPSRQMMSLGSCLLPSVPGVQSLPMHLHPLPCSMTFRPCLRMQRLPAACPRQRRAMQPCTTSGLPLSRAPHNLLLHASHSRLFTGRIPSSRLRPRWTLCSCSSFCGSPAACQFSRPSPPCPPSPTCMPSGCKLSSRHAPAAPSCHHCRPHPATPVPDPQTAPHQLSSVGQDLHTSPHRRHLQALLLCLLARPRPPNHPLCQGPLPYPLLDLPVHPHRLLCPSLPGHSQRQGPFHFRPRPLSHLPPLLPRGPTPATKRPHASSAGMHLALPASTRHLCSLALEPSRGLHPPGHPCLLSGQHSAHSCQALLLHPTSPVWHLPSSPWQLPATLLSPLKLSQLISAQSRWSLMTFCTLSSSPSLLQQLPECPVSPPCSTFSPCLAHLPSPLPRKCPQLLRLPDREASMPGSLVLHQQPQLRSRLLGAGTGCPCRTSSAWTASMGQLAAR